MKAGLFVVLLFLLSACSALQPEILPSLAESDNKSRSTTIYQRCERNFIQSSFQVVHSIEFAMANGHGATVIGVTVRDGNVLKCGLMAVEGFVLFEAVLDGDLTVNRALPPFDNPAFASGLMQDVQTLFVVSKGDALSTGTLANGTTVCRYVEEGRQIKDVLAGVDASTRINVYDSEQNKIKSILFQTFRETELGRIPETIELTAFGSRGYTLKMILLSVEKI